MILNRMNFLIGATYLGKNRSDLSDFYCFYVPKLGKALTVNRISLEVTTDIKYAKKVATLGVLVAYVENGAVKSILCNKGKMGLKIRRFFHLNELEGI